MSIFKKTLALLLVIALTAAIAVSGTLAYLQDEKSDVNVMTLGSVKIEQHEYQRQQNADGTYVMGTGEYADSYLLEGFKQNKPLYPATEIDANGNPYNYGAGDYDPTTRVKMSQVDSHGSMDVFVTPNVVDKFVTIENTGKSDAYVRTLYAFEIGSKTEDEFGRLIRTNSFMTDKSKEVWKVTDVGVVAIGGFNYFVVEYVYNGAAHLGGVHKNGILPAGDTTYPGLCQVYMNATATNADVEALDGNKNGTYDILVLSQAVQVNGFSDAKTALDTAFGTPADKATAWFGGIPTPVTVNTVAELQAALDAAVDGTEIIFGADITGNVTVTQKADIDLTINGNGYKYNGSIEIYGQARSNGAETLTIQNVKFVANETTDFIHCNTTESGKRYAHNVTIQNCSFTGNGAEVMGARFRQCYNITIKDCTANGMYGIIWATGGNGLVIDNVTATNCRNGISVGTSTPVTVKNCTLNVSEYGVRADNNIALTLENNSITARQPVIIRKLNNTGLVLNLSGNTLVATSTDNYQVILTTGSDDAAYVAPSVSYTLNGAENLNVFR